VTDLITVREVLCEGRLYKKGRGGARRGEGSTQLALRNEKPHPLNSLNHDILVWIRIRMRGSIPLTNGSRSGFRSRSCYFRH
jgi:hypothetical protein